MASLSSRISSRTSTITVDHQWDPYQVLDLKGDGRCVGYAHTTGRKCRNIINWRDLDTFERILTKISSQPLDPEVLLPELRLLASLALCKQWHRRGQQKDMIDKWVEMIDTTTQQAARRRRAPVSRLTIAASSLTAQSFYAPTSRTIEPAASIISSSTLPARSEAESLRRSIVAMQETIETALRRLDQIETPQNPRLESARPSSRVSRTDNSSVRLSTPSSRTLSNRSSQSSSSSASGSSLSSTPSVSSRQSSISTASSDSSTPSSRPAQALRRPQSPTSDTDDDFEVPNSPATLLSLHATYDEDPNEHDPWEGPSQIPHRSEPPPPPTNTSSPPPLHRPETPTPSSSSPSSSSCNRTHPPRRSLTEECPICYSGEPLSTHPSSSLTWCTSSCGRAVHKTCFNDWAAQCELSNRNLDCPVCRADWTESCACGGLSDCDAVHVERRDVAPACPICRDGMDDLAELQWCKDGCGQSVHKACMDIWKAHCVSDGEDASCTMCRAVWATECEC